MVYSTWYVCWSMDVSCFGHQACSRDLGFGVEDQHEGRGKVEEATPEQEAREPRFCRQGFNQVQGFEAM